MEAARLERERRSDPVQISRERRRVALQQRAMVERQGVLAQSRYQRLRHRLQVRAATGTYVAAGAAGLGVLDLATMGVADAGVIPGWPGTWFVIAAVSGLIGVRAKARLRTAAPPPQPALPPVPAPILHPGMVGAEESLRLERAEGQLMAMIPAVAQLHPEAGRSLQETVAAVQPSMHALVERLELISYVDVVRAPQAAEAAEALRRRLAQGVDSYDHLIEATATLLAAPDPSEAATTTLARATQELQAYAAGLATAAEAFDPGR